VTKISAKPFTKELLKASLSYIEIIAPVRTIDQEESDMPEFSENR
jgi:hypothetical protein